jgi:LmbE family N-acetylglucosaminyl deacetylase
MFKFIQRFLRPNFPIDLPLCQLPSTLDLSQAKRILVFAPHPDDEALGCGGTLALLASQCQIRVVLVTDGSGGSDLPPEVGPQRRHEWAASLAHLGVHDVAYFNAPDGGVLPNAHWQSLIESEIRAFQPNWIFSPSMTDYHRDHMAIAQMVHLVCFQFSCVKQLLMYEIWAPTWATHIADITSVVPLKRSALQLQKTSMQYGNYLQAIEGLNLYRGLYLGYPNASAEAFSVYSSTQSTGRMICQALWLRWFVADRRWAAWQNFFKVNL